MLTIQDSLKKNVDFIRLSKEEVHARMNEETNRMPVMCMNLVEFAWTSGGLENALAVYQNLAKKRNQSKKALVQMIDYFIGTVLGQLEGDAVEVLLKAMAEACEGKIFLEQQYAKCIRILSDRALERGDVDSAGNLVQDVQIETFGSVPKPEKVEYILYQLEIMLKKKDFIRAMIVANKIEEKNLEGEEIEGLRVKFYELMICYHTENANYEEISRFYKQIYDFTRKIETELKEKAETMEPAKLERYSKILEHSNFNSTLENYVLSKALTEPSQTKQKDFLNLSESYKKDLESQEHLTTLIGLFTRTDLFSVGTDPLPFLVNTEFFQADKERYTLLVRRLIQHNLLTFSTYFSRAQLAKISAILGAAVDYLEEVIASMVVKKQLFAKINRVTKVITFRKKEDSQQKLNKANQNIAELLDRIETTCHLIHKENLKFGIKS